MVLSHSWKGHHLFVGSQLASGTECNVRALRDLEWENEREFGEKLG